MGLIQRTIEQAGIPTISVTLSRGISRKIKPPRAIYTGFPLGHPVAFPHQHFRQLQLLRLMLNTLVTQITPGDIVVHKLVKDEDPEQACVLCQGIDS
ncbi:MAG: hypothetical protein HKP58_15945 [Desulfatitalea sp.]|nr:hypothetical protein [Desulfatitalea sp.]NNK01904.1 hypothetical protein [Desulfatitalea sp.]